MKMTILEGRATLTAATLVFCLFFSDTVEASDPLEAGKDCTHMPCKEGLYCVAQSTVIQMYGILPGSFKMCVECMSDYDCPASISCNDPQTPIAMCDWGAQKTFPGIDNIRKGYNGYKSDPLMYNTNSDPGFETEGFLFKWNYMESGTSVFTFNNELYDVPRGYFVNVEESCSLAMNTQVLAYEVDISLAIEASIEGTAEIGDVDDGDGASGTVGGSARASFQTSISSSLKTVNSQATCVQYVIEVDKYKLSSIPLDDHLKDFLETTGSNNATEKFDYFGLFDMKGTHYVAKAWVGSKFGITQTISEDEMEAVAETELKFKASMQAEGTNMMGEETSTSGSAEAEASAELRAKITSSSESLNKYTIGSSNIISLEEWSASSKLNPEVVKMEVGSICKLLDSHDYNMTHCTPFDTDEYNATNCINEEKDENYGQKFNNWNKKHCELEVIKYTKRRICYDIEVNTCPGTGSGTDAALHLSMYGKLGFEQEEKSILGLYMNDKISGNAFEAEGKDNFTICDKINVGNIYKINIRGGWDDWSPSNIVINGKHFNYDCKNEINYKGLDQMLTNGTMTYSIVVATANCGSCGMSANTQVKLKIYGKFNDVDKVVTIEDLGDFSDAGWLTATFGEGHVDNCVVENKDILDTIDKISVETETSEAWTLEKIAVNGQIFEFNGAITNGGMEYFSKEQ